MTQSPATPVSEPQEIDQRVYLHIDWRQLEQFLGMRGEASRPRIAYLRGQLELTTPSVHHEKRKKRIAALFEAYLVERGVTFDGAGSWTLKKQRDLRAIEPDECYFIGRSIDEEGAPDLAVEVIWTAGGLDRLEIYRTLGVREVWIWRRGVIEVHALESGAYQQKERSGLLPELDLQLLGRFVDHPSQGEAVTDFLAALRQA